MCTVGASRRDRGEQRGTILRDYYFCILPSAGDRPGKNDYMATFRILGR